MIKKILLTIAVIVAAILFARYKQNRMKNKVPEKTGAATLKKAKPFSLKKTAWIIITLMVLGTVAGGYYLWIEEQVLVYVDVINTDNAKTTTYTAYKNSIKEGRFSTPEGVDVHLGKNERMETRIKR